jgi:hypothetical protein
VANLQQKIGSHEMVLQIFKAHGNDAGDTEIPAKNAQY